MSVMPGYANSKRQCYFLMVPVTCAFRSSDMSQLTACCVSKVIQHHLSFRPYPPQHLSFCSHSVHKHIWCMLACLVVFVCGEMVQFPVSDLPFLPAWLQRGNNLCIRMSDVRLASMLLLQIISRLPYTHAHARTHTYTHKLSWKTKVTLWIRLPCSTPGGQKAPDRFTIYIVVSVVGSACHWNIYSFNFSFPDGSGHPFRDYFSG